MRSTFTSAEVAEARQLLLGLPAARRAVQRMNLARLRQMGMPLASAGQPSVSDVEALLERGTIRIDDQGLARAAITPHFSGHIFRVAVGVTDDPVSEDFDAFEQRYQWFGRKPQSVTSGAHLFVLAVGRWRSAVVGLYETVSAGADKLPDSPDPERWPWALGVKPLAAIAPPNAERVAGQIGPQSGLPISVEDPGARAALYDAIRESGPAPGPDTLEQWVQELEWFDVTEDILQAVVELGRDAKGPAVLDRARELGDWTNEELEARAWYTGSGTTSHVEHLLKQALGRELSDTRRLARDYGSSPYRLTSEGRDYLNRFGTSYRRAARQPWVADEDVPARLADLANLERATFRHMELQDRVADALAVRGMVALSPAALGPQYDLGFVLGKTHFVVEVKTGDPVSPSQMRLGVGQVLEYQYRLGAQGISDVRAVLCVESQPPEPWPELADALGVHVLRSDDLEDTLDTLVAAQRGSPA